MIKVDKEFFSPRATFDCGQVFRYKQDSPLSFSVTAGREYARVVEEANHITVDSTNDAYFENYFDLLTDYSEITRRLGLPEYGIAQAVEYGKGIRILRQEPYEALISFIVSANNNIPRIKSILNKMAESLGDKMEGYYAFPSPKQMADADLDFYTSIGAGYRARYLLETAKAVNEGKELQSVFDMTEEEASQYLMSFKGVGQKVADCIMLFAYKKTRLFPVDTWIRKLYVDMTGKKASDKKIRECLVARYGTLSGYAQQYAYYYKRENDSGLFKKQGE